MKKRLILLFLVLIALILITVPSFADEQISFETTAVSIFENEQYTLSPTVSSGLQGGEVTYKSGDTSVAKIDANGTITGVSKGAAVITASIKTAKQTYKTTVKVTVKRAVTSIELNEEGLYVFSAESGVNFVLAQNLLSDALPEEEYETGMSLERIIILGKGRTLTAKPVLKPNTASDKNFEIVSSDENVLPLKKQTLTGQQVGASIITISSASNPDIIARYGVLVVEPVTKLTVDSLRTTIGVGGTTQLTAGFAPENATFRAVKWTSENPKIASVDENGLVTGLAKGSATIRANAQDGSGKKDSVVIKVQLMPTAVTIGGKRELTLAAGKTSNVKASVTPSNASNTGITWSSSDASVARVNQEGRITAVSLGSCYIIAASSADPDVKDQIPVTVIQEVTSIKFSQREMSLNVGATAFVQVEVNPSNASNPALAFSVDNTKVATIDSNGLLQAVGKGSTTIRAKATDGSGKTASMSLTVVQLPENVTLDKTAVTINTGRSTTIRPTILPKNANNTRVTWESTDTSIAKVNSDGQITAVKAGTCQVICRAKANESVTATVDVTVHQLVTKITPAEKTLTINVKETGQIFWTVGPDDVTNPSVTLSSNKTNIATVDQNGIVYALKRGECTITIKADDGSNKTATVRVNVLQPVEGVYMKESAVEVDVDGTVRLNAQLIPSDASNTHMLWHSQDESIATVSGKTTRPTVTGRRWGTVEITGYTEDGGYSTSAWVTVQNYDTAVRPTDLYLSNNEIKLALVNVSNLNISRVDFTLQCFDIFNIPLACNINGSNYFDGLYQHPLGEGESTRHGRFNFIDYLQPSAEIGRVLLTVTSYRVQEGWRYDIPVNKQTSIEYLSPNYIGFLPTEPPIIPDEYIVQDDTQIDPVG